MEGLKNMMEDNVESMLNHLLPTMSNICSCNDCKLDMATYALNRLHPKYARTTKGAILHRFDTATTQVEAEILTACISAINIIGSHPHHEAKSAETVKEASSSDNASAQNSAAANTDNSANTAAPTAAAPAANDPAGNTADSAAAPAADNSAGNTTDNTSAADNQ